ncbi:MAG: acetyl-CoA C-acyltransferase, partial [bacterium]|nr:acetyl-CoA C-acyltransferase [bacterium]
SGVDPASIDDVILGCVTQIGAQAGNIARMAALSAGLPEAVPGVTIDRQCGSSQQAVHFAAQAIRSGDQDLVIAGGIEVMSIAQLGSAATLGAAAGAGLPRESQKWQARFGDQEFSQFRGAELIASKWGITREEMEIFALESHRRALAAADSGAFDAEIHPVNGISQDEGPRRGSTLEKLATLAPIRPDGLLTAATSSQISDGASAVLVASESACERYGLQPLARIRTLVVTGADPFEMLSAPIPATRLLLERSGLTLDEIDLYEMNEAFASVVLAWQKELGADPERINVHGGAIALGHPVGASGARLMATLVHAMHSRNVRYGLQAMCEGGGIANATLLERV